MTGVDRAIRRASDVLRTTDPLDDPLFPVALLRGRSLLESDADETPLLESWSQGITRELGAIRYRWAMNPQFTTSLPPWTGAPEAWRPWRARDATAWAEQRDRSKRDVERLTTPIILADNLDLLATSASRPDHLGRIAQTFLDEARPKVRRDAAAWVQELHAWADTWALWAIVRRPGALSLLYPFASAIAESYAWTSTRGDRNVVHGTRFPFHEVPIVSASSQLAVGLVALGVYPNLTGALTAWVGHQQRESGGWGDADGPPDLLTTLVAAELLANLDPTYDPRPTAEWFASMQRLDGWWRACGPEAAWLTVEIVAWLLGAGRPFAQRFARPHVAVMNRDRRTGIPFYGYFADLERLFQGVPGLSDAPIDVAFIDLAGFGTFNTAHGMEQGDRVLRKLRSGHRSDPGQPGDPGRWRRVHRIGHADRVRPVAPHGGVRGTRGQTSSPATYGPGAVAPASSPHRRPAHASSKHGTSWGSASARSRRPTRSWLPSGSRRTTPPSR